MKPTKPEVLRALTELVRREGDQKIVNIALFLSRSQAAGTTREHPELAVRQMVNGFVMVLLEALEGGSGEARAIFLETLIASLNASGSPAYNLVQWNGTYLTLLSSELMPLLDDKVRAEGSLWFAYFGGRYLADVMQAALTAAERRNAGA